MAWSKIFSQGRFWLQKKTALIQEQTEKIFSFIHPKDAPFPNTVLYDQAIRSLLFWGAGICTLFIGAAIILNTLLWQGYKKRQDLVPVIAASKDLESSKKLDSSDFQKIFIPYQFIPEGAAKTFEEFIGESLLVSLKAHEIMLESHVNAEANPNSVSTLFQENYAMSVDQDWFVSDFPPIYKNDWVDIIVYKPFSEEQNSEILIQKARVLQLERSRAKASVILNLSHEQAQSLFFAHSLKMPLQMVVYPGSSSSF